MIKIFVNISAVNIEDNIPIDSVTANPFIGPEPKLKSKTAAINVVIFASKIVLKACLYPKSIEFIDERKGK